MYKINCSYSGIDINIELRERISVLSDDSGVGKTFIANGIKEALNVKEYGSITVEADDKNITILDDNLCEQKVIDEIKNSAGLVIIDEADKVFACNRKIEQLLYNNEKAYFLLIMRGDLKEVYFSQKQYVRLERSNLSVRVHPYENRISDFFKGD